MAAPFRVRDGGAAAAELAVAMPAVIVILAAVLATALAGVDMVRCAALAGGLARAAARGEPAGQLDSVAAASGLDATTSVESRDQLICVTVRARTLGALIGGIDLQPVTVCSLNVSP